MAYLLALFMPPVALLIHRQPLQAIINLVLVVPCVAVAVGLAIYSPLVIPALHALVAIGMKRRDREVVQEIQKAERRSTIPVFSRWRERRRHRLEERRRREAADSRQNRA
jgi:hypothetical protein